MRLIVAGSRTFDNYDYAKKCIDEFLNHYSIDKKDLVIISGGAKGADKIGEMYAEENKLCCKVYLAAWNKFGKKAGAIRNGEMARNADALIAFWDGKSRGTKNMIDIATKRGLIVEVVNY